MSEKNHTKGQEIAISIFFDFLFQFTQSSNDSCFVIILNIEQYRDEQTLRCIHRQPQVDAFQHAAAVGMAVIPGI